MRKLKFRVWDLKKERFIYPTDDLVVRSDGSLVEWDWQYEQYEESRVPGETCIIQQFTGLTDIYNKELYEGDLVETIYSSAPIWEIIFDIKFAAFRVKCGTSFLPLVTIKSSDEWPESLALVAAKKIGNIFENSELLKDNAALDKNINLYYAGHPYPNITII